MISLRAAFCVLILAVSRHGHDGLGHGLREVLT